MRGKRAKGEQTVTQADIQNILRRKLFDPTISNSSCVNKHEEHFSNLLELVKRTALNGESNSVLLIGPRGAGKTWLMNSVLEKVGEDPQAHSNLIQVHLNGLLQTDDRIALNEITRQLNLETLATEKVFVSFAENLQFLLNSLKSGDTKSKSILFILDEFDLFCHHKNQTLLYNLFDVAQSAQTPITVIGLTCRLDVVEILEKRVKSRFSHRQIYIFPKFSFEEYKNLAQSLLTVDPKLDHCGGGDTVDEWNLSVAETFRMETVVTILKDMYDRTRDVHTLKLLLLPVIGKLSTETSINNDSGSCRTQSQPMCSASALIETFKTLTADSKSAILSGLSLLEVCLIIAMRHITTRNEMSSCSSSRASAAASARAGSTPFNFQMVYNEYVRFVRAKCSTQAFDMRVVLKAYEHLQALELVQVISSSGSTSASKTQQEFQFASLLVEPSQVAQMLQTYPNLPVEVQQWAGSSLL